MAEEPRTFSIEELKQFDGKDGRPCYIAYEGRVYDVTRSKMWRGGMHMRRHKAGGDLSGEMSGAPHDPSVLGRYPQVGVLAAPAPKAAPVREPEAVPTGLPAPLERFLARYPFFRRHPHPMTVHFPIVAMILAPLFTALYLVTGEPSFEVTAHHCLAVGLLSSLVVIPTGFLTWWINYLAHPLPAVIIKIVVSLAMFLDGAAAFVWRLLDREVITRGAGPSTLYLVLVFLLLPMILVVGWYGASLTFPLRKHEDGSR